ncbi:GFA family protein [Leptospira koniambonensis]|uniref:GFA family protein n=1 Tax=Leptospira koniambonensis TaxID=2484950 RepID=A0A4R9JCN5_9LEPT|nr:GFA family protein [Leptospira koniambonensis]
MCKEKILGVSVKPENFRFLKGEEEVTVYPSRIDGIFCKHCGVGIGGRGDFPEAGGKFISINLGTFDNLDPKEWVESPVSYYDGLHDRWDREPEFFSHL